MGNGYLVGYLDDGEFVEVGRFNNLDAVANSDLEIRHADSETRVVLGDEGFDFDGSDVEGVNALDVQSASVPQVTSNVDMNNNNLSGVSQLTTGSASVDTVASNVDFDSNNATGIGALEAESVSTETLSIEKVAAKATMSADQEISDATTTKLELNQTEFDRFDSYDAGNSRFVVPDDGVYSLNVLLRYNNWEGDEAIDLQVRIHINGSLERFRRFVNTATERITTPILSVEKLSEGDVVEIFARHDSGSTEIVDSSTNGTYLDIVRVG